MNENGFNALSGAGRKNVVAPSQSVMHRDGQEKKNQKKKMKCYDLAPT
jgi:hypothetical protein